MGYEGIGFVSHRRLSGLETWRAGRGFGFVWFRGLSCVEACRARRGFGFVWFGGLSDLETCRAGRGIGFVWFRGSSAREAWRGGRGIGFVLYPEMVGVDLGTGDHRVPCRLQKSTSGLALGASLWLRHCGGGRKEVGRAANGLGLHVCGCGVSRPGDRALRSRTSQIAV